LVIEFDRHSVSAADLDAIGLLQDPARRALYAFVVAQGREVSRNEAAEAVGLQRTLAAFHLDRLARAGLLDVTYKRLTQRSGPGAGRPAKLYRRPATERAVSLPPRNYARAANVFAEAIERSGAETTLYEIARERGAAAGRVLAESTGSRSPTLADLQDDLTERGYEPYQAESCLRLRNCPFNSVAREFPVAACGMNLALLEGLLTGLGLAAMHAARLDPQPGDCCVSIGLKQT
jgi:predicted ArsR family transcriptional regulator